jgi:hypothetical protein
VLGTVKATLGPATGNNANIQLMSVNVTHDATTGQYQATIAQ